MGFRMAVWNDSTDQNGRRRARRALFRADVEFGQSGRRNRITVLDLSTHGARLRLIHKLQAGDSFWLRLPGLAPLSAKVAWTRDFIIGCEFAEPLHPAVFDSLVNRRLRTGRTSRPARKTLIAI